MRAVLYIRQSEDRTGGGTAVARQLEDCRQLAQIRGWEVVAEYTDNDTSAAGKAARPGFERALTAIGTGDAKVLVAWNLDRLTRNRADTVRLIETGQAASATIAVVRGSDLDMSTPAGRMAADILAAVARNEIETKSDRQRRANEQSARAGNPPRGAHRAFGYTKDGRDTVEGEAALIREGYSTLLAGGSLRGIAKAWNDAGASTPRGNAWNGQNVRLVLRNPRYAALRLYKGEIVAQGNWPPIVDEATFQAARAILSDPSRNSAADRSIRWLLPQIASCGRCGADVVTGYTHYGKRTYKCSRAMELAVQAEPIDAFITELTIARLSQADVADLVSPSRDVDVLSLQTRANALRVRLDEAAQMFAQGAISAAQLTRINGDISTQLSEVTAKLAEVGKQDVLAPFVGVEDVKARWDTLHVSSQREIVRALYSEIVLLPPGKGNREFNPENVAIEWRAG